MHVWLPSYIEDDMHAWRKNRPRFSVPRSYATQGSINGMATYSLSSIESIKRFSKQNSCMMRHICLRFLPYIKPDDDHLTRPHCGSTPSIRVSHKTSVDNKG